MRKVLFLFWVLFTAEVFAQPAVPVNGPKSQPPTSYAFEHATIYVDHQQKLTDATLLIEAGKVVAVGQGVKIPAEARRVDCSGKTIYPAFIDLYANYGVQLKAERREQSEHQLLSSKPGAYAWNEALRAEVDAAALFHADEQKAKVLGEAGFGAVVSGIHDGICRGTSTLVLTADGRDQDLIIQSKIASGYSFSKGTSTQPYPSSLTGVIALLRQGLYDVAWYKTQSAEKNLTLEAWNNLLPLPAVFSSGDKLDILRLNSIAREFGMSFIVKGSGNEYQRLNEVAATKFPLILPLNFPRPFQLSSLLEAEQIPTTDLKHWEMAPANPALVSKKGITFSFTAQGCDQAQEFWKNLRKAVKYGLSETDALRALTTTPAKLIRQEATLGALKPGMMANFLICSGNIFAEQEQLLETWSGGKCRVVAQERDLAVLGEYNMTSGLGKIKITGNKGKWSIQLMGKDTLKSSLSEEARIYTAALKVKDKYQTISFWPVLTDSTTGTPKFRVLQGELADTNGNTTAFLATRTQDVQPDTVKKEKAVPVVPAVIPYPFTDFGWETEPQAETVLFKNATVWTNETDSILLNHDVLLEGGKISKVGKNLPAGSARVIDATGKFLTSGIIDEHSHIALTRGVNEGTQSVTSEVRMGDVINSEDVDIYRQLSGGVVASQLLHGSANPIGGQSALIKLRWGLAPEQMKIAGADGFIKFALGENVKQSNWGDRATFRYPQTRMGVEQTDIDAFQRAKEYGKSGTTYRDLELEALLEILNKKRFITCHSYVQSEINMLMHVADSFGFRVNTFTHILEGYKVADKMKKHGVGASTFADWWAYKYEVMEAIPYNAAILTEMGVTTAINSDDAEMGRRLNQEAAKTIKYGGMSEMQAWKMVTLNPAKLLHLDNRMGSIKPGKDGDVVLWNANPLSVYAKVLYTFVDGRCYYSDEQNALLNEQTRAERNRIIQKLWVLQDSGEKLEKRMPRNHEHYTCDTEGDFGHE